MKMSVIGAVYSDPFHAIKESWGGIRVIASSASGDVTVVGCDDGEHFWTLLGKFNNAPKLDIDFSPKAPRVGLLAATARDAYLEFADGNKWGKLLGELGTADDASPAINGVYFDPALKVAGSFAGLRVISDRLGKTQRDELVVVGTDDGETFWAVAGGTCVAGAFKAGTFSGNLADGVLDLDDATWRKQTLVSDPHSLPRVQALS